MIQAFKPDMLIFLGGTVGNNDWRDSFIADLVNSGIPEAWIFNPVVPDWNDEAYQREEAAKRQATHFIFWLSSPKQADNPTSTYSIHEAYTAMIEEPERTVIVFDLRGMIGHALETMRAVRDEMISEFGDNRIFTRTQALRWLIEQSRQTIIERELVILDGTCGNNGWRQVLLAKAAAAGIPADANIFFNPVVANWNERARRIEEKARQEATVNFFLLGSPMQADNPMSDLAIIRAQRAIRLDPRNTVIVFDTTGLTGHHLKSLNNIKRHFEGRFVTGNIFDNLDEAVEWLARRLGVLPE